MWWVTAAPFLADGRLMALARSGALRPWVDYGQPLATVASAAVALGCATSIALIVAAWRAHRQPPALWHQNDDQPPALITGGAYARIRHPLYSAYLLTLLAAALAVPHPVTALALPSGWLLLAYTARREERRLRASPLGAEYAAYMRRSGRFWPRWRSAA
jgi:protein-S-isoprenylcysteine O-methyltransferase Ste14